MSRYGCIPSLANRVPKLSSRVPTMTLAQLPHRMTRLFAILLLLTLSGCESVAMALSFMAVCPRGC